VIWAFTVLALLATLWLSLGAPSHVDRFLGSDKIGHAIAYAVDTFLLLLALVWRPGRPQALVAWMLPILLGLVALGGIVEVLQGALGRDADPRDWFADVVGAAISTVAFVALRAAYGASSRRRARASASR
jgi:VanZ family protein